MMLAPMFRRIPFRNVGAIVGAMTFLILQVGCATYQNKVEDARRLLISDPQQAAEKLKPLAEEEGRDQLVYLLDYATALQAAGRFEDSVRAFLRAEKLADLKDYHSITNVAGSLALSEEMVQYKGEDFEKVLINNMNALNFLARGRLDEALVEVRRVNEKLTKLRIDGKKDFNQSPLAFYLGAMIWESDRKFDDAYIAYKKAYDVAPQYKPLREDLIRAAVRAQRPEEVEKWKKAFPEVAVRPEWRDRNMGEIVVLYMHGWGPRKQPRPESPRYPKLVSVTYDRPILGVSVSAVRAESKAPLNGEAPDSGRLEAYVSGSEIYSIDEVAIKALDGDFARLVGSRVAGVAAKAVLADQLRQKDNMLGQLAWVAMNLADRADLRQWSTLPSAFQVARISLKAGSYRVHLQSGGAFAPIEGDSLAASVRDVEVRPQSKSFVIWRRTQ
jgi:tetratricopeptide (TPR) repeat protein